jgi:hypothetical protein
MPDSKLSDSVRLLPVNEVAHQLDVHPASVIRWLTRGVRLKDGAILRLDGVSTPGQWRISAKALEAFLRAIAADRVEPHREKAKPGRKRKRRAVDPDLIAAGY